MTDDSHDYTCTDCRHTGRPCMEALWLGRQLTRSLNAAIPVPERDITSNACFLGCGFACEATVRVSQGDVQIFCGIEESATPSAARLPRAMVLATRSGQDREPATGIAATRLGAGRA